MQIPKVNKATLFKTATAALCAATIWNCGNDKSIQSSEVMVEGNIANVALKLDYATTPLLDSLVLDCYGADTLHYVHSTEDAAFSMELFPSDHWSFKAKIYANGTLMQVGELETKLEAGSTVNLNIKMHAIVGFVYIDVPLGLHNEAGIHSGEMKLTSKSENYTIPMEFSANRGVFKSNSLKLGETYNITIALKDSNNKTIYELSDTFDLTEDSPVPSLQLKSLRAQVDLAIQAAADKNIELSLPLPAGYRKPKAEEILITEYFSAPSTNDTTQFEFVEIYNGSLDTLILDDCSLGITSSSSTKHFPLTVSEIAPSQVIVLGNPNGKNTPPLFVNTDGWVDMGNSKGQVILKCDGITLDSLYYSSTPDSLHTNVVPAMGSSKYGSSGQLNIDRWESRQDSSAWCLGTPTPGKLSFCD
ncbi:MAG: lamin tail domain-containing protein [Fibrobacter sp.]|nr:lamin tail domain-containing protein [Fibrobacter sp.]